jgi:hypothetical protein
MFFSYYCHKTWVIACEVPKLLTTSSMFKKMSKAREKFASYNIKSD